MIFKIETIEQQQKKLNELKEHVSKLIEITEHYSDETMEKLFSDIRKARVIKRKSSRTTDDSDNPAINGIMRPKDLVLAILAEVAPRRITVKEIVKRARDRYLQPAKNPNVPIYQAVFHLKKDVKLVYDDDSRTYSLPSK